MSTTQQTTFNRYKKYSTDLRHYYRMPVVQTSLTLALSLFIAAFFLIVALRPTFVTITSLKKNIAESEKILAALQQKATALQRVSTARDKYEQLIPFVDASIPPNGPRYQDVAKALEALAVESQVTISTSTLGDALTYSSVIDPYNGPNRTVITMPLSVQVSGSFTAIDAYFQKLVSFDRLVTIDSVSFTREAKTKRKGTEQTSDIAVIFTGKIYYIANQSQLSTVLPSEKNKARSTTSQEVSDVPEK